MAFEQSFINFNDVLSCFPSLIFHEKEAKSRTNGKTYELYRTTENRHFTKEFWQLIALKQLILDQNKLKKLPKEISQLPILNQLTLDKNKLKALPTEIKALTRLNYFSYGNNPLDKIEKARMDALLVKQEQRLFWGRHLVK